MTETPHRLERRIKRCVPDRVEDHIESSTTSKPINVIVHSLARVVDERRAQAFDLISLALGASRKYLRTQGIGKLNGNVSNSARPTVDQYLLVGANSCPIYESLPGRDED